MECKFAGEEPCWSVISKIEIVLQDECSTVNFCIFSVDYCCLFKYQLTLQVVLNILQLKESFSLCKCFIEHGFYLIKSVILN